jgi:hypothetical protein
MAGKFRWIAALAALGLWGLAPAGTAPADTVHFQELVPFVEIKLPGWQMEGKASGTTVKQGDLQVSEARASFRAGDKTLEISVSDFLGKPIPFLALSQEMEIETAEERVRTSMVHGFRALETFRSQEHQGELNIAVADRFWVKIDGDGIDSPEDLAAAARQMDLKKLAALAK